MTKRSRRTHSAALKAKVALSALKGDKMLAQQYDVHPSQITDWKQQLVAHAVELFGGGKSSWSASPVRARTTSHSRSARPT